MTQFKIGDKVRVTDGPAADREYFADVQTGDEGVVKDLAPHLEESPLYVEFDQGGWDDGWYLHPRHLELVVEAPTVVPDDLAVGDKVKIVDGLYVGETATIDTLPSGPFMLGSATREGGQFWSYFRGSVEKIEDQEEHTTPEKDGFNVGDRVVLTARGAEMCHLPAGAEGEIHPQYPGSTHTYHEVMFEGQTSTILLDSDEIEHLVEAEVVEGLTDVEIATRIAAAADLAEEKNMLIPEQVMANLLLVFTLGSDDDREVIRKLVTG